MRRSDCAALGREPRLLLVIIRNNKMAPDEEGILTERYKGTAKRAGLEGSKSFTILSVPEVKSVPGLRRFEQLLWEFASDWYRAEAKRIKVRRVPVAPPVPAASSRNRDWLGPGVE